MIDFNKFTQTEATELFSLLQKASEKSELEGFYLFTIKPEEKAKIFVFCHRFLCNVSNLITEGDVKKAVDEEIKLTKEKYKEVLGLLNELSNGSIMAYRILNRMFKTLNDKIVDDLIDAFSVFIERETIMAMSKLKGFVQEGKSAKEYKKIFGAKAETPIEVPEESEEPSQEEQEIPQEETNVKFPEG